MGNGEIFFLDTILLTPKTKSYQFTKAKVIKLAFSLDNIYFAYYVSFVYKSTLHKSLSKIRKSNYL